MDVSRAVLDNLMGRDRNKPKDKITERDHYSNPDVCKPFLVCFCFNTLFPNTTYDQGPCQKRHDTYLKTMFDNDPARGPYQRQYIRQCIHWIQRRLQDVQKKTKQNQSVIDNKSNFPADRPKQILDRILAIDQDIQKLIIQSQKYGQQGRIDDSARCLQQVQKLRQRRKQIQLMGSDMTNAQKQQKICLTCGAIQTINDTQKRIQTHLQGKIHQGFLKLRHQVQTLKIRLQVINKMNPTLKNQDKQNDRKQQKAKQQQNHRTQIKNEKQHKQIKSQIDRQQSPGKKHKRSRSRQKSKQRKQRHQQRQRRRDSKDRERRSRQKSKDRKQRKHHRDSRQRQNKQKHHKQHKQHKQHRDHKKKHKKNRSRSRDRQEKQDY